MKDFSNWTDEEINEAIFRLKGWFIVKQPYSHWEDSNGSTWYLEPIDYTHDWRLFGKLLEELPNCALKRWGDKWSCGIYDDNGYLTNQAILSDSPGRAICEAYLIWRHQE